MINKVVSLPELEHMKASFPVRAILLQFTANSNLL